MNASFYCNTQLTATRAACANFQRYRKTVTLFLFISSKNRQKLLLFVHSQKIAHTPDVQMYKVEPSRMQQQIFKIRNTFN